MIAIDRDTNKSIVIDVPSHLYGKQLRKVSPIPQLVVQLAHYIADVYVDMGLSNKRPAIHVNVTCSLNSRPPQLLIGPKTDLTQIDWRNEPLPIVEPLEPLPVALTEQYPWKWPWTLSWLTQPWNWPDIEIDFTAGMRKRVVRESVCVCDRVCVPECT
jgi:hypothetical protein